MGRGGQDEEQAFVGFWFLVWVRLMSPKITQVPETTCPPGVVCYRLTALGGRRARPDAQWQIPDTRPEPERPPLGMTSDPAVKKQLTPFPFPL